VADTKISALTQLTTPASADEIAIVDKSDTTQAASGTTKRMILETAIGVDTRTLVLAVRSQVIHDQASATLGLVHGGYAATNPSFSSAGAATTGSLPVLRWAGGDHDRTGLTTMILLRAQVAVNGTAAGITFTFGVYPITVGGAADTLTYTLGTVLSGSTTSAVAGNSNVLNQGVSTALDVTGTAAANWGIGCVTSGNLANNSSVQLSAQLWRYYQYT
jgi:hypothetical protein